MLAGGGMRVAWQAGVVKALAESGRRFHHIDGTSGGTMTLAMILSGLDADEICRRWRTLRVRDFASLPTLKQILAGAPRMGWGTDRGIRESVFPALGISIDKIRQATELAGTFNVCNFSRKTNETIAHADIDLDRLVAGISLPIFMPPIRIAGDWYTDSVWVKDANLMEAVKRGAEEIWLVWCIGNSREYRRGAFNQYVHMIEMSANGVLFEELDRIRDINARIAAGETVGGRTRPIRLHVIKPEVPLPLDPDLYLGRISTGALVDLGYADALRYLATARPEGVPLTPDATAMREPGTGVAFGETMAGPFAFGSTDPVDGARAGAARGTTLALHARIAINDLDAFIGDPEHEGRITADVDVPGFGTAIPGTAGVFKLFAPTPDPGVTWMVYETAFRHDGRDYYLAGRKHVGGGHPLSAVWRDTTTLFTRLHDGRDASAPVIGAGVLRLSVGQLVSLVRTFSTTGVDLFGERLRTAGAFGGFFTTQLRESYLAPNGRDGQRHG